MPMDWIATYADVLLLSFGQNKDTIFPVGPQFLCFIFRALGNIHHTIVRLLYGNHIHVFAIFFRRFNLV